LYLSLFSSGQQNGQFEEGPNEQSFKIKTKNQNKQQTEMYVCKVSHNMSEE
jgi:hypothetical protein